MEKILDELTKQALLFTPRLATALVIFLAAWISGKIVCSLLVRISGNLREAKNPVVRLAAAASKVVVLTIGCVTALGTIGVNVTALVAGLGLSGFALGFALKDVLSNFLAGALILIYRPFDAGDRISVSGGEGEVVEVNLRYTVLQGSGNRYLVPNSTLLTNLINVTDQQPGEK
jgi:small conductance mechanosensitive channel